MNLEFEKYYRAVTPRCQEPIKRMVILESEGRIVVHIEQSFHVDETDGKIEYIDHFIFKLELTSRETIDLKKNEVKHEAIRLANEEMFRKNLKKIDAEGMKVIIGGSS